MAIPIFRRFSLAAPAALNTFAFLTDDVTALTFYPLAGPNTMLDMVNDPDPAAGLRYEVALFVNGIDSGRHFFSNSLSSASAGRVAIGPIDFQRATQIALSGAQRAGALTAQSFLIKLARA